MHPFTQTVCKEVSDQSSFVHKAGASNNESISQIEKQIKCSKQAQFPQDHHLNECENSEHTRSNSKDHLTLISSEQTKDFSPLVVLNTTSQCIHHPQDMLVEMEQLLNKQDKHIREDPEQDQAKAHQRYNTRWKRIAC